MLLFSRIVLFKRFNLFWSLLLGKLLCLWQVTNFCVWAKIYKGLLHFPLSTKLRILLLIFLVSLWHGKILTGQTNRNRKAPSAMEAIINFSFYKAGCPICLNLDMCRRKHNFLFVELYISNRFWFLHFLFFFTLNFAPFSKKNFLHYLVSTEAVQKIQCRDYKFGRLIITYLVD